jgi:hypothetical protein
VFHLSFHEFVCVFHLEISSFFGKSFLFLFIFFVLSVLCYFLFHMVSNLSEISLLFNSMSYPRIPIFVLTEYKIHKYNNPSI